MRSDALFSLEEVWLERSGPDRSIKAVLRGANAHVPTKGITCLVGPSGTGKSSLLRLLNRLESPTRGVVRFHGADLATLDPLSLRRKVGLVLQMPIMLPGTVRENLGAGAKLQGRKLANPEAWLERVGLEAALLDREAQELSGGEKQRVALARTLATEPEVLLLDEVTSSLDAASAAGVEALIQRLGMPSVWVSHDPAQVRRVADRVLHLEEGLLREEAMVR